MYQKGDPLVSHLACIRKQASASIKQQTRLSNKLVIEE